MRLERVWSILQVPVTAKLDWVIRYTGEEQSDLFEPGLGASCCCCAGTGKVNLHVIPVSLSESDSDSLDN